MWTVSTELNRGAGQVGWAEVGGDLRPGEGKLNTGQPAGEVLDGLAEHAPEGSGHSSSQEMGLRRFRPFASTSSLMGLETNQVRAPAITAGSHPSTSILAKLASW
jgi:hypothetical protein